MTTLRVFTERKKSCYSITSDKGSKVLVRASFFYGNYDGKSSPPSFDLQFDGNYWTTVETSSDEVVSYEAIYVTKMDAVSVCVAQTSPNMFPFISAVEVRDLDSKMYGSLDSNHALMLTRRVAFGTEEIIRYVLPHLTKLFKCVHFSIGLSQKYYFFNHFYVTQSIA